MSPTTSPGTAPGTARAARRKSPRKSARGAVIQFYGYSGIVIYDGPSMINGSPILGILTWESGNRKTGEDDDARRNPYTMAQLWIVPALHNPIEASQSGTDASVCGGCPHRGRFDALTGERIPGTRTCYVELAKAPLAVYSAWSRGSYIAARSLADIRKAGEGIAVRLGAWGDPAALPAGVVRALTARARGWTGYTHQWRSARLAGHLKGLVMASCDSPADTERARSRGWSTFTVLAPGQTVPDSVECRNSRDGTLCADCLECDGKGERSITIEVHGPGAGTFTRRALPVLN